MSRQECFSSQRLYNGGWDSELELDTVFSKMLELNTIYGENFRFFNEPEEELSTNQH